jgi:hypothetical protein
MPGPLERLKWERFAQCLAHGMANGVTQGEAYKSAGYVAGTKNSADAAASRLLRKVKPIIDRARELQAIALKLKKVTVESIVDELEEARELAKANDQSAAMVAASTGKAKLLGLVVDRTEQGKPGDFNNANDSNAIAKSLLKQAGMKEEEVTEIAASEALQALEHFQNRMTAIVEGALPGSDGYTRN